MISLILNRKIESHLRKIRMRIGMFGTFDVENYGDLLFPLIAERELRQRLKDVIIINFSYNEKNESSWVFDVSSLADLEKGLDTVGEFDLILIGGGHLIRFDKEIANQYGPPLPQIPHPMGYWLTPALAGVISGRPVIWNAPSTSHEFPTWSHSVLSFALSNSAYVSVRDQSSAKALRKAGYTGECKIVPDTAFSLARHFPRETLRKQVKPLLSSIGLCENYIVVQATPNVAEIATSFLAVNNLQSAFDILALPIGPILGDDVTYIQRLFPQAKSLPVWPSPKEIAGIVAFSRGVIGISLHLSITALAYGLPVLRPITAKTGKYAPLQFSENVFFGSRDELSGVIDFAKAVQLNSHHLCSLVKKSQSPIQEHWDAIAAICRKSHVVRSSSIKVFSQVNSFLLGQEKIGQQLAEKSVQVQALKQQIAERYQSEQNLLVQMADKEQAVQAALAQIVQKEQLIQELTNSVNKKEQTIQTLSALVAERERSVQSLTYHLAERNYEISEIKLSKVWRVALVLRRFRLMLIPPNSFRSKVVRRFYNMFLLPLIRIIQKKNTSSDLIMIRSSELFNATWYLTNNPDLTNVNIDPAFHYLQYGGFEGRNPSPNFNSSFYISSYPDVKKDGINPLIHYIKFGKKEGRACIPGNNPIQRKLINDSTFTPKVTIVVPNYNHANYLEKRLSSIYHQSYSNYEVILLDDCSSDQSREILMNYQEQYPTKTRCIFNNKNSGSAFSQWKKGLENAKGELIWIAESDDYCDLDFLEKVVPIFIDETILLSYCHSIFVDENDRKHIFAFEHYLSDIDKYKWDTSYTATAHSEVNISLGLKNTIPNVSSAIFRRPKGSIPILNDPNWLNMKVCGDWLFYLNIIRGGKIAYCNDTNNFYRIHKASTSKEAQIKDVYYQEHEAVACAIASLYDVPDELMLRNYHMIEKYYLNTVKNGDINHFNLLFSLEKVMQFKRKRIPNILIGVFAFSFGGGEVFPIRLANSLKEKGTSVVIINGNNEAIHPKVREMINPEIPVINYDRSMNLNELVKDYGIEIAHTHHATMDRLFSTINNIKHVVTMHGMYEMMENFQYNTKDYINKIDHWFYTAEKNLIPFKKYGIYTPKKFTKMRNGMAIPKIHRISLDRYGVNAESFTVCLATRALSSKGWLEAIDSVTLARESIKKDIHLLLIGEGPLYESLRNKPLPYYIHLLGYKSNLVDYFAASQLGFLPTYFKGESFPLVIIECFMAEKPIIASKIGEIPDMIITPDNKYGGALIDLHKGKVRSVELASALIKMITDEKYYQECVNSVKELKTKFDLDKITEMYLIEYAKLNG